MWGLKLIHMAPSHWPLEPQKRTTKKTPHKPLGKGANLCPRCSPSKSRISPLMNLLENSKDEKEKNSQIKKYSTATTPRYAPGGPGVSLGHKAKHREHVCSPALLLFCQIYFCFRWGPTYQKPSNEDQYEAST